MEWKPFLRQIMICSGTWSVYFMHGLCLGFPTVAVPQLRKAKQNISDEEAAWIPATNVYAAIPWIVFLSGFIVTLGRKKSHIIVCLSASVAFIILYFSINLTHILISELLQGALFSAYLTVSIPVLTEYTSPKYRGVFLTIKSATFFWGILAANTIGTFYQWQNIPIVGLICAIYAIVCAMFWPESPLWLASKGKFEECTTSHKWLKGDSEDSKKELEKLLKSYENVKLSKPYWSMRRMLKAMKENNFLKALLIVHVMLFLYYFSGNTVLTVFALDILKQTTKNETSAYSGMLILDGVTVLSMYLGCFLSKILKRRTMLFGFTAVGIVFLFLTALYVYLVKLTYVENNKYVSIVLLSGYSISISVGPMILLTSIMGELLPLQCRSLFLCLIGLSTKLLLGTLLKLFPYCSKTLSIHGTFTLFASASTLLLILLYIYLPETKDKTLVEINDILKGKNNTNEEEGAELMNIRNRTSD